MKPDPESLLNAWFGEGYDRPQGLAERTRLWFAADPAFDELIRSQFGDLPDRALRGDLDRWRTDPRSTLALVLALDQLPRNLFRGTSRAFHYDAAALDIARNALAEGIDRRLHPVETVFLYLPLEHAEEIDLQLECVHRFRELVERAPNDLREHFESYLSFSERHRAVIERFGRFPHRNDVLERSSTPEELRYLEEGGETFSGPKGGDEQDNASEG